MVIYNLQMESFLGNQLAKFLLQIKQNMEKKSIPPTGHLLSREYWCTFSRLKPTGNKPN